MKTKTIPLRNADYISNAGQISLSRIIDDAVQRLDGIRICGVGRQRGRSRGVIYRSFCAVLVVAGFSESQAHEIWRDQVLALETLNTIAEAA